MFDTIISVYTRQQAIEDGIFIDITEAAKMNGFRIPVAVTTTLFYEHIKKNENQDDQETEKNLNDLLQSVYNNILTAPKGETLIMFKSKLNDELVDVWAALEAQSPYDHSPALNIMMPSDY